METLEIKKFRKKHNCKSCLHHKMMKKCEAIGRCPLDDNHEENKNQKKTCPLDETGNCPYQNASGTCFGFCLKQLMKKMDDSSAAEQLYKDE